MSEVPVCLGTGDPATSIPLLSLMGRQDQGLPLRGLESGGIHGLTNVSPLSSRNFYSGERCLRPELCWSPGLGPESVNSHLESLAKRSFPPFRKRPFLELF